MSDSLTSECNICCERYMYGDGLQTPRVLHSNVGAWKHTFCTKCLLKRFDDGTIDCFTCRVKINVTEVDKLPVDIDVFPVFSCKKTEWADKICTTCDQHADAVCHPCGFYICMECREGHKQFRKKTVHTFIDIKAITDEEKTTFKEIELCKRADHNHYVKNKYCLDCRFVGCHNCMDRDHEFHKTTNIENISEAKQNELRELHEGKGDIKCMLAQNERKLVLVTRRDQETLTNINRFLAQFRDLLNDMEQRWKSNIKVNSDQVHSDLTERIDLLNKSKLLIDSSEPYLTDTSSSSISSVQLIQLVDVLAGTLEHMRLKAMSEDEIVSERCEFLVDDDCFSRVQKMLGSIIRSSPAATQPPRQRAQTGPSFPGNHREICIFVMGKHKSGRGKMCHYLMKKDWMSRSQRSCCKVWSHEHEDIVYKIVYTPGTHNRQVGGGIKREKSDIYHLAKPGPHAILMVVNNPDEDVSFLDEYQELFNDDITRHVIIVFIGKDSLDKRDVTIDAYVESRGGTLQNLVRSVDNRYIACNSRDKNDEIRFRNGLFQMVKTLVLNNDCSVLTLKT